MPFEVVILSAGLACLVVGVALFAYACSQLSLLSYESVPSWDDDLPQGAAEVLAALSSAVVVLDTANRVVKATAAAFALGLVREGKLDETVASIVRSVRQTGLVDERELEFVRGLAGPSLLLGIRVVPLGPLHVLVLAEDHTEAHRVEEVRRDFAANVSHELKTPVGAISLLAEALVPAADDPEAVARFASMIEKESTRLNLLVQEIIDLSKLQAATGLSEPELVAVDDVLSEAIDRCRLAAEAKSITVERGGARGIQVFGERGLLVTAVGNLVDNAVHYSDEGTRIGIGVRRAENFVEISVADEGIGISATERERIFERFYRVDKARSRATGGTGLGLSIVKHIVANHGGEVAVASELGRGSTFTLRLPAAPADRSEPRGRAEEQRPQHRMAALRAARPTRKASA